MLTFEDSDAMFEPYQLGYYNGSIGCWSDLVDPPATEQTIYKIVAYGYDASDTLTASTELVLCQGTNPITDWVKFDLSVLGKVAKVLFNFAPSDDLIGDYGMNTPAYFAYDDVAVQFE